MTRPHPRSPRTDTLFPYTTRFRSDAGHLFKILQQRDVDAMSKQTRRAMVEAIDVSTAACALTFAGDIIIEADEETIFLANQKGASVQYARANQIGGAHV